MTRYHPVRTIGRFPDTWVAKNHPDDGYNGRIVPFEHVERGHIITVEWTCICIDIRKPDTQATYRTALNKIFNAFAPIRVGAIALWLMKNYERFEQDVFPKYSTEDFK